MRYLFDDYTLDTERRELHRGAEIVPVTPQVFDLLAHLIHNRERVVSKEGLIDAIWDGRTVSDAAVTTRLNAARSAIGDSGEQQRLIKTLPRKGFRFIGMVREARGSESAQFAGEPLESPKPALALPDKPSIVVLPFANLSSDPEQEYFADGMVDDIIAALSRFKFMFVIARNTSFTYKGRAVDIKQIGRELGVRYVLEGSVRKAAGKLRISGQLIDATSGAHLWADRFEGDLADVFALQDKVSEGVVSAISPKIFQMEVDLAARRPNDLSAYDLCLRAVSHLDPRNRGGPSEALRLVSSALEIDPRYGFAATLAAACHFIKVGLERTVDPKYEISEGFRLLLLALSIDRNNAEALGRLGNATAAICGDFDAGKELVDRAVALNPNVSGAWGDRGWTYLVAGESEEAIRSFERGIRLSPLDPWHFGNFTGMSLAFIDLGRFEDAVAMAKKALSQSRSFPTSHCCLVSALVHLGRETEALDVAIGLQKRRPGFCMSKWIAGRNYWRTPVFFDGLRRAGLPA